MAIKISELTALQKLGNTGAAPNAARSWDFAYTWNAAGTTFVADFMNITNTASAAGSLLIDRQVGGVSQFSVSKAGVITNVGGFDYKPTTSTLTLTGVAGSPTFTAVSSGTLILRGGATQFESAGASPLIIIKDGGEFIRSDNGIKWSSTTAASGTPDLGFSRNAAGVVEVNNGTAAAYRDLKVRQHYVDQTITAAGTTGAQTINKAAGTVNIAAAGTAVTVTNSLCTTSSTVYAVIRTNDGTARVTSVVPAAGSFVINIVACTAEVSIGFLVIN